MQLIVIGAVILVSVVEPRPNDTTSQSSLMLVAARAVSPASRRLPASRNSLDQL
jgi:hypothetical protein